MDTTTVETGLEIFYHNFRRKWGNDVSVYTKFHQRLNQIECWFSILVRRLLKRSSFRSLDDLAEKLHAFIDYFNAVLAKPFKWTYTGRPLQA